MKARLGRSVARKQGFRKLSYELQQELRAVVHAMIEAGVSGAVMRRWERQSGKCCTPWGIRSDSIYHVQLICVCQDRQIPGLYMICIPGSLDYVA